MIILYGGSEEQVRKQLACSHLGTDGHDRWHGPCMDDISRYNKCLSCFALQRDFQTIEEYYRATAERTEHNQENDNPYSPATEAGEGPEGSEGDLQGSEGAS